MEKVVKKREANIELLRIIAMLMVVTLHCVGNGKLLGNESISTGNLILIRFLDSFSLTANSIFIIITGYYSINKKFDLKKVLNLWGKTILYASIIFVICKIQGGEYSIFNSLFPVLSGQYWFISSYIALYFLIPIINIILNKLNQKQLKYLLIISIILFGIIRGLFNPAGIFNSALIHMVIIYILGAYIRKYVNIRDKQKYFIKYILFAVIFTVIYIILNTLESIFRSNTDLFIIIYRIIALYRDFMNILLIAMTVLIFMKFKTISIKSNLLSKIITFISPSVFSIYIIHQNVNIRDTMWLQFWMMNYANSWMMIPYIILMVISVFTVCLLIDLIRRAIYYGIKKIPIVIKFINKINEKIEIINNKVNSYLI